MKYHNLVYNLLLNQFWSITPVQQKSIQIDIIWAFPSILPVGSYRLTIGRQTFSGTLSGGQILIDQRLDNLTGNGELEINVTNGPIFRASVILGLAAIQTPQGLKQRLTNLGFYAGTDAEIDNRACWAIRAFKRVYMNGYTRNMREPENNTATQAFLLALQAAYGGSHPGDVITGDLALGRVSRSSVLCGMFGSRICKRGSFENTSVRDDVDPHDVGNNGRWAGESTSGVHEPIVGPYELHLRAFDPSAGDNLIPNRVALPQPIRMTQLVLFELGYWVVRGAGGWTNQGGTETRISFTPTGEFDRYTQWALREFQCHSKMANAAVEDVTSTENLYLMRLFTHSPAPVNGIARYPDNGRISGALNERTRNALQLWADETLRCPIIVYASTDNNNTVANGSNLSLIVKENLWLYNDHANAAPRMYAIDYSGYYTIPAAYSGNVNSGGHTFPRPIVLAEYVANMDGGQLSHPLRHVWQSQDTEVRPDTMIGRGGLNGVGLTAAELSTFKVVRTAAHFECLGYFDVFNAYDDVTISFGPCHWTLARCSGNGEANEARELPAFLAYMVNTNPASYQTFFGNFGLTPESAWPIAMSNSTGTYSSRILIQTEAGTQVLCGISGTVAFKKEENKYAKSWHWFYRFQMACRTSPQMRLTMWGFTRIRVRDIQDKTFTIGGVVRQVGDYVTSEKGTAMLLRWHIYRPAHLFRPHTAANQNHLQNILTTVINAHPNADQARETAMLQEISNVGGPVNPGITNILGMVNVPQQGTMNYYHLNLANPTLSDTLNSFNFAPPP